MTSLSLRVAGALLCTTLLGSAASHAATFYSVSNKADSNTVVAYTSGSDGSFSILGEYKTGGTGTGDLEIPALKKDPNHPLLNGDDPLISANSIERTEDGKHLIVVNPGDATISLLKVAEDGALAAVNSVKASDKFPISIAINGSKVVVASVGKDNGSGSIGAFELKDGELVAVEGSRRDLMARPSTIRFSSDGNHVIVNELVTGKIHAFAHDGKTLSEKPVSTVNSPVSEGRFQAIPVGFTITQRGDKDIVLMSEARFLTPDFMLRPGSGEVLQSPGFSWQTSSLSTYSLTKDGQLELISGDVLTGYNGIEGGELSNCWVVLSKDGNTLWSINPLSSSYSSFDIAEDGFARLNQAQALKLRPETLFFGDATLSPDGDQIYQLISNTGQVMVININENNVLQPTQMLGGLPELGSYGMVAID
ncbi:conserved hypothetical protein [Roseibium sp. TrichSKD4]|uniref:hypothetical protein n=1 Tax=Roseibium sp. TrichSKD4 TaxID=744980 RepID=UPI0001E57763|nr:hypothetical protein [Roseibium sp. TrichSKD4]EFO28877.1 conserved hypothetical protein [Roseibium sp. TrichSKD4]